MLVPKLAGTRLRGSAFEIPALLLAGVSRASADETDGYQLTAMPLRFSGLTCHCRSIHQADVQAFDVRETLVRVSAFPSSPREPSSTS